MSEEPDGILLGSGVMQQVDTMTPEKFEKALEYHTKSKTHMWMSIVQYLHTDNAVKEAMTSPEPLHMDKENLVGHHIGCFICEEQATPRSVTRACKGQPKGELRYV